MVQSLPGATVLPEGERLQWASRSVDNGLNDMAQMIAACGLDCVQCDIRQARDDPALAQEIIEWFKRELDVEVKPEDLRCDWCRGDRAKHWSPDCWILECCVDDKGLESCHQCEDFPCQELSDWSKKSQKYSHAFERLRKMTATGEA